MIIQFPSVGIHGGKPIFAALRCQSAEGGTSGKNSTTDQHQTQNTTGTTGDNSPNLTAADASSQNFGTVVHGNYTSTDLGAVASAFSFGDTIAKDLGKVYAASADAGAATSKANTDFLSGVLGSFSAQTDAGQSANNNKTLLYLGLGLGAVVALVFLFRK